MKRTLLLLPLLVLCSCAGNNTTSNFHDSSHDTEVPPRAPILVAYFSATGTTKPLAEYAAERYQCDIFEITPVDEYGRADINYANQDCRALREQADEACRPEIKNQVEDMSKYSAIVLGYPIWALKAPRIVFTFLESYDFSGKQILPFCTSGSSDISVTIPELTAAVPNATWLEGKRFAAGTDKATFTEWLPTFTF